MEHSWVVWKCSICGHAYGRSRKSKDSRCPHCNQIERAIISNHEDAAEARKAISVLNTPPEIREQLEEWIEKKENHDFRPTKSQNVDGETVLDMAESEDGIVNLKSLQEALDSLQSAISAEDFADNACTAGELMICGDGTWRRV